MSTPHTFTIRMFQVTEHELEMLRQPFSYWARRRIVATIRRESGHERAVLRRVVVAPKMEPES